MTEKIHVKNIEKYQPKYTDGRRLIWIRWDIASLTDEDFSELLPRQKWLLIGLTLLETQEQKPISYRPKWIARVLNYEEEHIVNDINMLQKLGKLVTKCDILSPTDRQTDIQTENISFKEPSAPVENSVLKEKLSRCKKSGFNIYALMNRFKKDTGYRFTSLPDEVVEGVADAYLQRGKKLEGDAWPYFMRMLRGELTAYNSKRSEEEGEKVKDEEKHTVGQIGKILAQMSRSKIG